MRPANLDPQASWTAHSGASVVKNTERDIKNSLVVHQDSSRESLLGCDIEDSFDRERDADQRYAGDLTAGEDSP